MKLIILLLLISLLVSSISFSQSKITLRRSYIDSIKNTVTITANFDVWFTHHKAKSPKEDGDIHCSGYDNQIGMPVVAEIMNAKNHPQGVKALVDHEGKGSPNNPKIKMTGVWRLWPEHLGGGNFFQGMRLSKGDIENKTTNPDHVFEIHPITNLQNIDVTSSITNIQGYDKEKDAREAFDLFSKKLFYISSDKKFISFSTRQVGDNYINLWIRVDSSWKVKDGALAYCTIFESEFDPVSDNQSQKRISKKTRIVFPKNSETYKKLISGSNNQFIHILGIPRISLAIISWRVAVSAKRPEVLAWRMPVELIAVGIIE